MPDQIRSIRKSALALLALLALTACPGVKPIRELLDDPGRYENKTVRIAGEVTKSVGVLGVGAYEVTDGTGTLAVVSEGGNGTPRVGAKIVVEGVFHSAFTIGSTTAAALIEKDRRTQ